MSAQPLHAIWDAAASHPFTAAVPKETQFSVGFFLLLGAIILSGLFGLNNNLKNLPVLAVPASLAFGFGAVYMICAVGVYTKEYSLYRPRRRTQEPVAIPAQRPFHPVTSTLFILSLGITGFFVAFALALYLVRLSEARSIK